MAEAVAESVIARCGELTPTECRTFLEKGYVVIKGAFPREVARQVEEQAWRSLGEDSEVFRKRPENRHEASVCG